MISVLKLTDIDKTNIVTSQVQLFIMPGCNICPQMERIFEKMHQSGEIQSLEIFDVTENSQLAERYNIRSVPFYLINDLAYTGLKSVVEIKALLDENVSNRWREQIKEGLSAGNIQAVQTLIESQGEAAKAMIELLKSDDTDLLVRIGLSAVIESMASNNTLFSLEDDFIQMSNLPSETIAIDAMYYLSLVATPEGLAQIAELKNSAASETLREQARELLEEIQSES